jgi:hypothetical protein
MMASPAAVQRGTSIARAVRQLKEYQRVMTRPGELRPRESTLSTDELCWNDDTKNVIELAAVTP